MIEPNLYATKHDDVAVDDRASEALHAFGDARVPKYGERTALQELKACLNDGGGDRHSHNEVEKGAPWASLLEAQEEEGDRELHEGHGPVPEELGDEEVAHCGGATWGRDEAGAAAEAVEYGEGENEVLDYGEDLEESVNEQKEGKTGSIL
ncbi:uncharacterized protein N0V89_010617 [Didymosphaeria variabile]|uniref:Uncharacterized protein n=1 Tax=Didymosphaeria variabile TaxID=1932322 RepID=A0A9W9C6B2_9PLEO|nr:uncharacterized protein N0V89_010617 [Didymosphaeria variabile]KAJ4346686.1 hypothetical protein N0V89_010617 [Didymosphaeria variabile]